MGVFYLLKEKCLLCKGAPCGYALCGGVNAVDGGIFLLVYGRGLLLP